jgi:hypothetical protein
LRMESAMRVARRDVMAVSVGDRRCASAGKETEVRIRRLQIPRFARDDRRLQIPRFARDDPARHDISSDRSASRR